MGMGGKGGKFNMGAMQSHLNQNIKTAQTKERLQQKLEQRRAAMIVQAQKAVAQSQQSQQPLVFSTGEKVERTPRVAPATVATVATDPVPATESVTVPAPNAPNAPKKPKKNKK
jgi:hypothetical protein